MSIGYTGIGTGFGTNNTLMDQLVDQGFSLPEATALKDQFVSSGVNDFNQWGQNVGLDSLKPEEKSWSLLSGIGLDGLNTDSIAKGIGFDSADSMKDFGGMVGGIAGFGNTLYGMYNQGKMFDMAKDNYDFQKGMAQKQWDEAMNDKAEFKANRAAATKAYYGK